MALGRAERAERGSRDRGSDVIMGISESMNVPVITHILLCSLCDQSEYCPAIHLVGLLIWIFWVVSQTLDGVVELKLRLEKGDRDIDSTGFVSEESEKGKWQSLNLQQLNDLQSKLMLVAGKAQEGKKEVDNFVEVSYSFIRSFIHSFIRSFIR